MLMLPDHIKEAIFHYCVHMDGWTTPERGAEMASRIIETKAKVCVDIGVYAGRSTIAMGFAARELGDSMVYGIDPWKLDYAIEGDNVEENAKWWKENSNLEEMHRQAMRAVWSHRLDKWITIIRNGSQYVHQLFPVIDFLNVDGCHTELASCRDVELYLPRLRSGGYLTFDDTAWETTQPALRMVEKECELIATMIDENKAEARTYRKL